MTSLAGQPHVSVVVGAAGGIGAEVAAALARRGQLVVGIDRHSLVQARETHVLAGEHPAEVTGRYQHVVADITEPVTVVAALARAAEFGPLTHLISVAGGALAGEAARPDPLTVEPGVFERSVEVNLSAQFALVQAALPHLRVSTGDRSVTLTSSINAVAGVGIHGYSAAKAGLLSLTRTLAVAEGQHGIRVNCVVPGTVPTPRTQALYPDPAHFETLAATTALGRCASMQELAAAYVALALDLTAVTGQDLVVDAGQTARWR